MIVFSGPRGDLSPNRRADPLFRLAELFPEWLRRFGLFCELQNGRFDAGDLAIVASGQLASLGGELPNAAVVEASCNEESLYALGIRASGLTTSSFHLSRSQSHQDIFGAGVDFADERDNMPRGFRAIRTAPRRPRAGESVGISSERGFAPLKVHLQRISAHGDDWEPILWAFPAEQEEAIPVGLRRRGISVFGLPIFALLGSRQTLFPLSQAYYDEETAALPWSFEVWMRDLMFELAEAGEAEIIQYDLWPRGYKASFTLRHDYDRMIPKPHFNRLLSVYEELGIQCSIGFLKRLLPASQAYTLVAAGHEAALHSTAVNYEDFIEEVAHHTETLGERPAGVTFHGGSGAFGIRGSHNLIWAERAGLEYCETYLKTAAFHYAKVLQANHHWRPKPISIPFHLSFDAAHYLPSLSVEVIANLISRMLGTGQHVTLMNHPDLYSGSLIALLRRLDLSDVWCATHAEISAWARKITDLELRSRDREGRVEIVTPSPLPHDLVVRRRIGASHTGYILTAGNTTLCLAQDLGK